MVKPGISTSAPIAAKGGITALTKNLSIELAADGIRINAVAPGVVPTPLYGELTDEQLEALHGMQPLGRYGKPKDIADAVLYLANAEWVTGVICRWTAVSSTRAAMAPAAGGMRLIRKVYRPITIERHDRFHRKHDDESLFRYSTLVGGLV